MIPEHQSYSEDLASGILALKKKAETTISDPGIRKRIIDSIANLQDVSARVVKKGQLKKGKRVHSKIDVANIVQGKRKRKGHEEDASDEDEAPPKWRVKEKQAKAKDGLKPGDAISVAPQLFDGDKPGSYSKDNPERQFGTVVKVFARKMVAQVKWIDGSRHIVKLDD